MLTFRERLSKTMAAAQAEYGDLWLNESCEVLIEQLAAEAADIAGWAWVLHCRAARYPDAERGFVRDALEHLAVLSIRIMRAIAVLAVEGPYADEVQAERRTPEGWLDDLMHPDDWQFPRRVTGRIPVVAWADLVRDRLRAGALEYGDQSFERDGGELCVELGDEAVGLAGWAYVMRARAETIGVATRVKVIEQLGGLVRAAAAAYDRVRAVQYLCVGVDTANEPAAYRYTVEQWIAAVSSRERRNGVTGTVEL